jgi:hypothetical protein
MTIEDAQTLSEVVKSFLQPDDIKLLKSCELLFGSLKSLGVNIITNIKQQVQNKLKSYFTKRNIGSFYILDTNSILEKALLDTLKENNNPIPLRRSQSVLTGPSGSSDFTFVPHKMKKAATMTTSNAKEAIGNILAVDTISKIAIEKAKRDFEAALSNLNRELDIDIEKMLPTEIDPRINDIARAVVEEARLAAVRAEQDKAVLDAQILEAEEDAARAKQQKTDNEKAGGSKRKGSRMRKSKKKMRVRGKKSTRKRRQRRSKKRVRK